MDLRNQFRKVSDDVSKIARDVADSSKKAAAKARLRRMIHGSEESLQSVYSEIGARYYIENQCEPDPQFVGLFEQAADLITQIDVLKAELAGLDHGSICPECGNTVNDLQKFCPECGTKNAAFGKWQAEAQAAEAARRAAKEAERAEREARKAEKAAQNQADSAAAKATSDDTPIVPVADTVANSQTDIVSF